MSNTIYETSKNGAMEIVKSGIRAHAIPQEVQLESSILDHLAILTLMEMNKSKDFGEHREG